MHFSLLFVNTLFTQKGWFNGNGSSECRNLKKVPRERDNSMNVILQRPILRLSHNNSDIPRVKCWYISDLNSTHFSGEEEKRTWKEWLKVRWKGGAETCNCCKTRLATSQPLISSQKRAKRAWMRLRRITNQEKKNYRTLRKSTTKRVELPCCAGLAKKRQAVVSCEILLQKVESSSTFCNKTCTTVADPGPGGSPLLFLDQNEVRRAKKIFFWDRHPPLSQGLDDDRAPPLIWRSGSDTVHVARLTG